MISVLRTAEFAVWIDQLKDVRGKQRILRRLDRLEHGNPGDVKPVGHGVSELRMPFGPGYRVYFLQDGDIVILLLCGGDKSTQRKDIDRAHQLAEEWRTDKEREKPR